MGAILVAVGMAVSVASAPARTEGTEGTGDGGAAGKGAEARPRHLAHWRFNQPGFPTEAGFLPMERRGVPAGASWSGTSAAILADSDVLRYGVVERDGSANLNLERGSLRLWFRPNWTSRSLGGRGIGHHTALIQAGSNVDGLTWVLSLWDHGDQMDFTVRYRGSDGGVVRVTGAQVPIAWRAGFWTQVVLTYSATHVAVYLNGELASHDAWSDRRPVLEATGRRLNLGEGLREGADPALRQGGVRLGHRFRGGARPLMQPCNGWIDEVETFDEPLTAAEVARGFHTLPEDAVPSPRLDTDDDGRSDFMEVHVDGTSPTDAGDVRPVRLGYWRFNDAGFTGERGQVPWESGVLRAVPGWSGNAVDLGAGPVRYRAVEANGWPNFSPAAGGVRFWFRPRWNSGSGPSGASLVWLGDPVEAAKGAWMLRIDGDGTLLRLVTSSNRVTVTNLTVPIRFRAGTWTHVALNYGRADSALFVDGDPAVTGSGVGLWPGAAGRAGGWLLGGEPGANRSVDGDLDELETRNAPWPAGEIAAGFRAVRAVDHDLNGRLDVTEDRVLEEAEPFLGEPFAVTGAFEAEQYDQGGPGVAYQALDSRGQATYRPGPFDLRETTDRLPDGAGGSDALPGFDLLLRAGEWVRYTVDVRVAGTYAVEARVGGDGVGGGVFRIDFRTRAEGTYATTGPLTVPGTGWSTVGQRWVHLRAGRQELRLAALANLPGRAVAGRFNYLAIYPCWEEGVPVAGDRETRVTGLVPDNDSWSVSVHNASRIQEAIHSLRTAPGQGGRIRLPPGVFYVGQPLPDETRESEANTAVYVGKDFLELRGAGRTNTQLVAHNRATTVLSLGRPGPDTRRAVTQVTLRDLTLAGRPHRRAVRSGATGFTTVTEPGWLAVDLNLRSTGALVVCDGERGRPTSGILVTNCEFRNPSNVAWLMSGGGHWVSNLAVRGSVFLDRVPPDGYRHNPQQLPPGAVRSAIKPAGSAHLWGRFRSAWNVVVVGNSYHGNVGVTQGPDATLYNGGAGLLWLQGGGNYYAADNVLTNYYLEGMQVNGGPAAMVRNRFVTFFSTGSCTAFNTFGSQPGASGALAEDIIFSVLSNRIEGGRNAVLGTLATISDINLFRLDVAGNWASLEPLSTIGSGPLGVFVGTHTNRFLNLSGNRLASGGHALTLGYCGGVAFVLHNDFGGVEYRGILDDSLPTVWRAGVVVNNVLGRGMNDHFRGRPATAARWFFRGNRFRDGAGDGRPRWDPPELPVHWVP